MYFRSIVNAENVVPYHAHNTLCTNKHFSCVYALAPYLSGKCVDMMLHAVVDIKLYIRYDACYSCHI